MCFFIVPYRLFQPLGDLSDLVLGHFRLDWFGQFRIDWDQRVHSLLRTFDVRLLLRDQYHRSAQSAHCHDEPLLPTHLRQLGKLIFHKVWNTEGKLWDFLVYWNYIEKITNKYFTKSKMLMESFITIGRKKRSLPLRYSLWKTTISKWNAAMLLSLKKPFVHSRNAHFPTYSKYFGCTTRKKPFILVKQLLRCSSFSLSLSRGDFLWLFKVAVDFAYRRSSGVQNKKSKHFLVRKRCISGPSNLTACISNENCSKLMNHVIIHTFWSPISNRWPGCLENSCKHNPWMSYESNFPLHPIGTMFLMKSNRDWEDRQAKEGKKTRTI